MSRPLRRLAEVFAGEASETPFGGRAVSWTPVCVAWLAVLDERREAAAGEAGSAPGERARMTAETRADPRLERGQRLRLDGAEWRLAHVTPAPDRPGRVVLSLEQEAAT